MASVLLVTGGSRGIGAATAVLASRRGYQVCVNYRQDGAAAQDIVERITSAGGTAIAVQADVAVEEEVVQLFQAVDEKLGRVDALVNNAGILATQARVARMTAARINHVLTTNVTGYFMCAREAVLRMSTRYGGAGGAIVNVSSVAARSGAGGEYVDYAASKGAIDSLTVGLAAEVAAESIRVNAVRPAFIYTDIHASGGEADRVDRVKSNVPLGRGGYPEEVARAIMWLLSDEASYTTGSFIEVSGGK